MKNFNHPNSTCLPQSIFGLVVGMMLFSQSLYSSQEQLMENVSFIQQRYQSISSFTGEFEQTSIRNDEDSIPVVAEGKVSFVRPGKMRWEYETPEEQLLVTDGETVWLYDPLLGNVTVQQLSRITEVTALDFLLGVGDLTRDFFSKKSQQRIAENFWRIGGGVGTKRKTGQSRIYPIGG